MRPDQPVGEQVQAQPRVEGVPGGVLQVLDLDGHHGSTYAADVIVHGQRGELVGRLGPVGVAEHGEGNQASSTVSPAYVATPCAQADVWVASEAVTRPLYGAGPRS